MSSKSIAWTYAASAGSFALPVAVWLVWPDERWPAFLFALCAIAAAIAVVSLDRRAERKRHSRMLELMQNSAIETLSHHRHDWLNEMQILYGYLRLNKPDKAIAVVDRIRKRMEHDSRISHLGVPKLAAFFLSFRTVCDSMRLEVEIDEGFNVQKLGIDGGRLTTAVIGLVNVIRFRVAASMDEENVLKLSFRADPPVDGKERNARLEMTYEGKLAAKESLGAEMERVLDGFGKLAADRLADPEPDAHRRIIVTFPQVEQAV